MREGAAAQPEQQGLSDVPGVAQEAVPQSGRGRPGGQRQGRVGGQRTPAAVRRRGHAPVDGGGDQQRGDERADVLQQRQADGAGQPAPLGREQGAQQLVAALPQPPVVRPAVGLVRRPVHVRSGGARGPGGGRVVLLPVLGHQARTFRAGSWDGGPCGPSGTRSLTGERSRWR